MHYFADIFGLGTPELVIILLILLLLFGGKKLPDLFRSVGKSVNELRKGVNGETESGTKKPANTNKKS
ncbi:MAG: twin-arginine translocase TatA/TatE family subunit [Candidatus Saccharimonadales bacterium]